MAFPNQLNARNVHIFRNEDRSTELAGFFVAQPLMNTFVYEMLDILVIPTILPTDSFYFLLSKSGARVERNEDLFQAGTYYLDARCKFLIFVERASLWR